MEEKGRIENSLPIWLWRKSFEITKIFHYASRVICPLLRIEDYRKYKGGFKVFIERLKQQLIDNKTLLDNKTVYEIQFFHSNALVTLYCGFYDGNFTIGLGATTESFNKPSEVHLFKKENNAK